MSLSPVAPVGRALERTKLMLFAPFDAKKWLVMGFAAFIAKLGEGGGGGNLGRLSELWDEKEVESFVRDNLALVLTIGALVIAAAFALGIVLLWVSSRGKFVLLDNVVRDRAAIGEPWRRYASAGRSLFWFRLALSLAVSGVLVGALGGGVLLALGDIQAQRFGTGALIGLLLVAVIILPVALLATGIGWILDEFAVPMMYQRGLAARASFRLVWREVVRPNAGAVFLFWLLEVVLGIGAGVLVLTLTCLTCCIAGLPYVSSVVFLPVSVFLRSLSLYFLEQLGPDWQLITPAPPSLGLRDESSQFIPPQGL